MTLPPFPLDEQTLQLLDHALDPWDHGDPAAVSSLGGFLEVVSAIAGSDTAAVEPADGPVTVLSGPRYSDHDLIRALVAEVRALRVECRL